MRPEKFEKRAVCHSVVGSSAVSQHYSLRVFMRLLKKSCCGLNIEEMSDSYPEYLNPFAEDVKVKPKSAIRNSFKEFKRSLRQSFRIKKKDEEEVTIRQKSDTLRRPVTYSNAPTEALPRSRFRERLTRIEPDRSISGQNPFEEDEETKLTLSRRRPKKRAPLPPKSLSSQNINEENLEVPTGGSHWSLTSVETDYSGMAGHEDNEDGIKRLSLVDNFTDFNKNMEELKDDTNNNNITNKDVPETESHNIPDLVISCPNDTETSKEEEKERTSNVSENEETKSDVSSNQDLSVKDITDNLIVEDNVNVEVVTTEEGDKEPFMYHEKKSLYIPGSRDELNTNETDVYTGTVSLYITGSCDELDASNNNEVCDKKVINEDSNDDAVPIPKQRKNKLTKNILLGM